MFRIEMLPAAHGDCLLLTYGEPGDLHHVLIDGGPYYRYQNKKIVKQTTLLKRLQQLVDAGGSLEALVITHIDADHIEGIVKLLGQKLAGLEIQHVWFNNWDHLLEKPTVLNPLEGEMLSALIKTEQIRTKRLSWNGAFGGKAVAVQPGGGLPEKILEGGLRLTLLSPTHAKLAELANVWEKELRKEGLDPDCPDEALERLKKNKRLKPAVLAEAELPDVETLAEEPFECDTSEPNGSSIAFIAEYGGKRCLFAGDAHPTVLESSIRRLPAAQRKPRLKLDAFKVPHHASKANVSSDLLELLNCQHYLISTNGDYFAHPDREAIARIIVHGGDQPVLHFNYCSPENGIWANESLKDTFGYQTKYGQKELGLIVDL
jgi:beta-lactamase superfamily II metal-dependent hydrolase